MMLADCNVCSEEVVAKPVVSLSKIDRTTASYKEAIASIMKLNPKMKRAEAVKLFDKTYKEV